MRRFLSIVALAGVFSLGLASRDAFADGTETLGPQLPGWDLHAGAGMVAAGVGVVTGQPKFITFNVPAAATVKQAIIYMNGYSTTAQPDQLTIVVGGQNVLVNRIGGNTNVDFGTSSGPTNSSVYRSDITGLGLVLPGPNSISVQGLNFNLANNGAGILVIFDDGGPAASLGLRDGQDYAFINAGTVDLRTTVPQTFTFAASALARTADLNMFFSSVQGVASGGGVRPSVIEIKVDGVLVQTLINQLSSADGDEWDTLTRQVAIPAGATSVTVQALSQNRSTSTATPASFVWVAAGLAVRPPAASGPNITILKTPDGGTFTQGGQAGFNIVVENNGGSAAANVKLSDQLPTAGGLSWINFTTTHGACTLSVGSLLSCNLGTLQPGVKATVTVSTALTTPVDACRPQLNPLSLATADGGLSARDSGSLSCVVPGRMTGGGSVLSNGLRVTHGFELHCNVLDAPNNLEINWDKGNSFHMEVFNKVTCTDDPAIIQKPPKAGLDTLIGVGTGRLNGVSGATAEWTFVDAGEPGSDDTMKLQIKDNLGNIVLTISGFLEKGNHQAH